LITQSSGASFLLTHQAPQIPWRNVLRQLRGTQKALAPVRTAMLCSIRKVRDLIDLRLFAANADACWREADMASALALPPTATRHLCANRRDEANGSQVPDRPHAQHHCCRRNDVKK
jgi:hypothetical protein